MPPTSDVERRTLARRNGGSPLGRNLGVAIVVVGAVLVVVGLLVTTGAFSWFGRLPGDIRVEGERSRVYVPIVSMLLVSVLLSVVLNLLRRWF